MQKGEWNVKRILPKILAVLLLCLQVMPHARAAGTDTGGNLDQISPTKAQISGKWYEVTRAENYFSELPSVSEPYAIGQLSDNFLQNGITYLNYVRYVANLPKVQMDDALNESAQYGAVVLAANNKLTHTPKQPDDMDDTFFNKGYKAVAASNISAGYGTLQGAILGCMTDSGSLKNVGHRRWFLNPKLLNVGFGCAISDSDRTYITTRVFDKSGSDIDYDFVSWPASGNHPTNLFQVSAPWSVTLNPQKYQTPQLKNLKVTLTRQSDNKKWNFDAATGEPESTEKPYLTVNTGSYGVSNCIIFHPGSKNVESYQGVYTVEISGLYTKSGDAARLQYQVDFFDVTDLSAYKNGTIKKVNGVWKYDYEGTHLPVTTLVKHSGSWYHVIEGIVDLDYVGFVEFNGGRYYVKNGKVNSKTTGLVKSNGSWYYVVDGKLQEKTTLVKHNGEWFYVVNGRVASGTTTLVKYNGSWYYIYRGKLASQTSCLVKYNGGWYYVYKGKVASQTTTLVKHCGVWYYVKNGKVDFTYTGPFLYAGGTYQITNGKIA